MHILVTNCDNRGDYFLIVREHAIKGTYTLDAGQRAVEIVSPL